MKHHRYRQFFGQWLLWLKRRCQRHWLPLLLGIIGSMTILGIWQQLVEQEQLYIQTLVHQEANTVEKTLNRELLAHIQELERMANRWETSGGTAEPAWRADAANYIQDFFGYETIEWIDSSLSKRWVEPLGNQIAKNLSRESQELATLQTAKALHQTIVMHGSGEYGKFLVCVPLFVNNAEQTNRFDGFIAGVFQEQLFFDSILSSSPYYTVQIRNRTHTVYQQDSLANARSVRSETAMIQAYGAEWQIQVFPTSQLIAQEQSLLPTVVLWGGLIGAWSMALIIDLRQKADRQVQHSKATTQRLQHEMIHRRQIEANLRASEERWQLALRGNKDGVWDWDVQADRITYSPRCAEMLGYADDEQGNSVEERIKLLHPDDRESVMQAIQDHLAGKTLSYMAEYQIRCKDGSYRWLLDRGQAFRDADGNVLRMVGSHTNITERKQVEIALRESESTLRSFFNTESMLMGIVELHENDILHLSDNQTTARFFGTTSEAMRNRFASEMGVSQADLQNWINAYREAERYRTPVQFEYAHQAAVGQRWLAASVCQIANDTSPHSRFSYIVADITERRQAEIALEKELMHNKTLFSTSIDGIVTLDNQGKVIQTSSSFARMIGYTVAETLSLNVANWDALWTSEELQQMLRGDVPIPPLFETCHRRKDGSIYDVEISYSKVELDGEMVHFCICREISERKRIEAERQQAETDLRQSEATKQAIIQAIPDLLIRMRTNGEYIEFITNDKFRVIHPDRQRQNTTLHDVLPPNLVQQRLHYAQQAIETGITQVYEQEIWIEDKLSHEEVRIASLALDEVLVMVRDITARKTAEKELCHQKEMFQAIVDHIPVMITLFDHQGQIEFVNCELQRRLGWSIEDWYQRDVLAECYPDPAYRQIVLEHMLAATRTWRDLLTYHKNGQLIETAWANVQLSDGRFVGIGQDISERKYKEAVLQQAMESAEAANLAKSMFLANMSHELRTPLNIILGFTQVMAHDFSLTPSQQEDLQTIQRSGNHLLNLINDILDISKIEAGHCIIEAAGFDLIALLHTLRSMIAERARAKQLQVKFVIDPEVPQFVIADEQKLRQILLNLLSNAVKFTNQGSITLRVTVSEISQLTTLQFQIIDTGIGIASEELSTIFDAFVQAEAGRKSVGGTGLGLTISHKLLELMGGAISVDSTLGQGSTFTFTLPAHSTSKINIQAEHHERIVVGLISGQPQRRILVVDDQLENRQLLTRLLTQIGLEIREAANGQEAIQLWQEWQPHLVWMDIRMPGIDGYEATKQIRAMEQEPLSIIIALTAQASQSDRALALAAGCNDYISKPFREESLFLKMAEYLNLKYLYAEPASPEASTATVLSQPFQIATLEPELIADLELLRLPELGTLSKIWLSELEEAAACGSDRAILDLAKQLPSEFAQLQVHLTKLASQFQFELILNLLHHHLST